MKKIILLVSFMIGYFYCFSQNEVWSNPAPITDSITDNRNPILIPILNDAFVFWEKSIDENSTAIYRRNISEMEEPIELFGGENIHYRNPQYISFDQYPNPPDTLFYLFFESDFEANGVFNLYYSKYSQDGNFSSPESINFNYTGCEHTRIFDRKIVYESNGLIETIALLGYDDNYSFSDIILIDQGNVKKPVIGNSHILYEKEVDNKNHLYLSKFENEEWLPAEEFYTIGDNASATVVSEGHYSFGDVAFVWESFQNEEWQIYGCDIWDDEIGALEYTSTEPLNPHAIFFDIPIGQTDISLWLSYLTFIDSEEGNGDVFVNEAWGAYTFPINISNSEAVDTHPKLFSYSANYTNNIFLLWESTRNNHQQLYMCSSQFWVDTEDIDLSEKFQISPNPTTQNTQITFNIQESGPVWVDLIDISGSYIDRLLQKSLDPGSHEITFMIDQILENGIYFIQLKTRDKVYRKKLILQR